MRCCMNGAYFGEPCLPASPVRGFPLYAPRVFSISPRSPCPVVSAERNYLGFREMVWALGLWQYLRSMWRATNVFWYYQCVSSFYANKFFFQLSEYRLRFTVELAILQVIILLRFANKLRLAMFVNNFQIFRINWSTMCQQARSHCHDRQLSFWGNAPQVREWERSF